ncbi:hypothetical protein PG996_006047 [Apiospora saccharicola]|uniref:Uncharacterized protein n=1 Tax=Apiospora saccharicola TaxID=335842 RepID=A0ABR1VN68_9PEZI
MAAVNDAGENVTVRASSRLGDLSGWLGNKVGTTKNWFKDAGSKTKASATKFGQAFKESWKKARGTTKDSLKRFGKAIEKGALSSVIWVGKVFGSPDPRESAGNLLGFAMGFAALKIGMTVIPSQLHQMVVFIFWKVAFVFSYMNILLAILLFHTTPAQEPLARAGTGFYYLFFYISYFATAVAIALRFFPMAWAAPLGIVVIVLNY